MPTRCNRWIYFLLNMFRAPLCPSSGAREYYTGGCCLSYLVLWISSCRYGVELRVMCPVCGLLQHTDHTDNLKSKAPNTTVSNHLCNTLELLMMGIVVPETCWASNKICNKNNLLYPVGILFPHINEDARSKSHQIRIFFFVNFCHWYNEISNKLHSSPTFIFYFFDRD